MTPLTCPLLGWHLPSAGAGATLNLSLLGPFKSVLLEAKQALGANEWCTENVFFSLSLNSPSRQTRRLGEWFSRKIQVTIKAFPSAWEPIRTGSQEKMPDSQWPQAHASPPHPPPWRWGFTWPRFSDLGLQPWLITSSEVPAGQRRQLRVPGDTGGFQLTLCSGQPVGWHWGHPLAASNGRHSQICEKTQQLIWEVNVNEWEQGTGKQGEEGLWRGQSSPNLLPPGRVGCGKSVRREVQIWLF